nr:immunoglobulin heavy chain junction region [Macaca mulatta]MOV37852.1 immunoglobulin heavy chain junction region [Macaca mulatta]MOV37856.1 immunoglobulin heavy chain junction region [Macaca mulatta]MOV37864.1 immunoglobulin heavy chain junction region [Macaca mulatta]MOV37873.1 immunoglobulin heavy chain junction region [Macaca mulatta]
CARPPSWDINFGYYFDLW